MVTSGADRMSRSLFSLVAAGVTLGGLGAVVCAAHSCSRLIRPRPAHLAALFLLCYSLVLLLRPSFWPVIDLAVLAGAVGGVLLIQGGLTSPQTVVAFLIVAAVVDLLSMSGRLSRAIVERYRSGSSQLLLYLTLVVPIRGRAIPIVGIGDLLVGGTAATALLRHGLRPVAVMAGLAIGLLAALAYGLWRGGAPAVPFIAVATFVFVWRHSARIHR